MRGKWNFAFLLLCFPPVFFSCSPQPFTSRLPYPVKADQITAFVNVHLVPMTHEVVLANHTVIIKGTRIAAIGPSNSISVPPDATIIDGDGRYLMPGLADMHIHTSKDWPGASKWQTETWTGNWPVSPLHLFLANGVTTVRCLGPKGEPESYILSWRDRIKRHELAGPRIYSSGGILWGPVRAPVERVREQKATGYDLIKLYSYLSEDELRKAISAAKDSGMYSVGHIPFQVGLEGVLSAGLDEVAHVEELLWEMVIFDRNKGLRGEEWMGYVTRAAFRQLASFIDWSRAELEERFEFPIANIARKIRSADVPVCTTLHVDDVIVEKLHAPERFLAKPENCYLPEQYLAAFRAGREKHQVQFKGGEAFAPLKQRVDRIFLKHLRKAGVPLVLGTDAGTGGMGIVPGFSIHDELQILVQEGFSPYEALMTGTVHAAMVIERMTGVRNIGTVEPGKAADLILAAGNPLEDVANLRNPLGVMAGGRWFTREVLDQMLDIASGSN